MFANIKNRFISVVAPDLPLLPSSMDLSQRKPELKDKFPYARPAFLQLLTNDELRASADHNVRPIIVPRDINLLPWGTGYAECVNSGKSRWNEDQAAFVRNVLSDPERYRVQLPYTYFGIFDGHAGYGAALAASKQFHHILHEKLVDCIDMLLDQDDTEESTASPREKRLQNNFLYPTHFYRRVTKDELIIGALESAFFHMDSIMESERSCYLNAGGCTACVALFINGKLYVGNAGDSRAVLCQRNKINHNTEAIPFSTDHTPESEKHRLSNVACLQPHLLDRRYVAMEYAERPQRAYMGRRILCRQGTMNGWTYKTVTQSDFLMPVVMGVGKRSRLLGTLGVTRGFGDHDLYAINTGLPIKPFLSPQPDVVLRDLSTVVSIPDSEYPEDADYGILVMATDGLWDVSENEAVANTVFETLEKYPTEKHRYTMVAQELVAKARGKINKLGHWRLADSKAAATVDDISVIVIPVHQYYKEHLAWLQQCKDDASTKDIEKNIKDLLIENDAQIECHQQRAVEGQEQDEEIIVELEHQQIEATKNAEDDELEKIVAKNAATAAKVADNKNIMGDAIEVAKTIGLDDDIDVELEATEATMIAEENGKFK